MRHNWKFMFTASEPTSARARSWRELMNDLYRIEAASVLLCGTGSSRSVKGVSVTTTRRCRHRRARDEDMGDATLPFDQVGRPPVREVCRWEPDE